MLALQPVMPLGAHQLLIFVLQVGLLLMLAVLLGRLAVRLGMPAIVGELAVGVLLGPSLLAHVAPAVSDWLLPREAGQFHLLDAVAQIGVLLLVGLTGIQMDFKLVRRRGATAAKISIAGLVIPLGFGIATGYLLPASLLADNVDVTVFAMFLGVAMCVSAIPVIAKTLMDMNLLHRNVGQLCLTAGMLDDAFGWFMLSVVSGMATTGIRASGIALSLLFLVVVFAIVVGRPLVRVVMRHAREPGTAVVTVVVMVLLSAAGTHALGLEAILGAFVCGILIGRSGRVEAAWLAPLNTVVLSVLAPLFFATAGLRMDLTRLTEPSVLAAAAVVLVVAVAGKFLGAYIGARLSRLTRWEALALGAGMNARGVVEVIVAMVGLRLGVLNDETYTIIVLVAIVTSLMAPPILRFTMNRVEQTAEERLRLAEHDELVR
ncbi:transporter, CPA2 family [Streptosporangium subroseum]|uniref:Transporter, CPA2 family n=1 Tax=Streptosporangium subroseum TaxID=106412 RepID=A0A239K278_9ACTN|nr:cation:proton antiporter [Streptosporangium subroseum]SNT11829.1 transporter, CPA2 family [Streptosporangium subroseum]